MVARRRDLQRPPCDRLAENLVKVISWYDNESGFSARMLDLTQFMATKGL